MLSYLYLYVYGTSSQKLSRISVKFKNVELNLFNFQFIVSPP